MTVLNKSIVATVGAILIVTAAAVLILLWSFLKKDTSSENSASFASFSGCPPAQYNYTYPRSPPTPVPNGTKYRIAVISDLDEYSKINGTFISYFKKGYLTYNGENKVSLDWDSAEPDVFSTNKPEGCEYEDAKCRAAEFSELVTFDGKLLTVDDKTGLIYEIDDVHKKVNNWTFLADGDGTSSKGFKGEWATVKDGLLYVGSHGRENVKDGKITNHNLEWIKTISMTGNVTHINWQKNFNRLRNETGAIFPGYMNHEACVWSAVHKRWFFLPRQISAERFNFTVHPFKCSNVMLISNADFSNITSITVGELQPTRGFSSFKFIPGSNDTAIVALKSEENAAGNVTASYVMAFTVSGEILYPVTKIADEKYEGIEFI